MTCAKYIVQSNSIGATRGKHVLFVVHLPQRSASHNYTVAVDGWEALHCDCLLPPDDRHPLDATHLAMTPMRLSEIISGTGAIGVEEVEDRAEFERAMAGKLPEDWRGAPRVVYISVFID